MEELDDKLSLVESECKLCDIKDQEIRRMRSELNDYSKQLKEAQKKDTDSNEWIIPILGFTIYAEVGLAGFFGWKGFAFVNGYGVIGSLVAWGLYRGFNYFFGDAKPGYKKVRFVTKSGPKNKTE